jgi:hypothetical protein
MELGEDESWVLEQARKTRSPIPEQFLNAPELFSGLDLYYMAFMDLTSCRQLSQGVMGPISWANLQSYCNEYGIHGEQREDLFYFTMKMDEAYLKNNMKRAETEMVQARAARKREQSGGGK